MPNNTANFPAMTDGLPEYTRADGDVGNENVGADDLQVPRIKLLQSLSPECVEGFPGAKPGLLMSTVTDTLFESLYVVNLGYVREWTLFKKKKHGGGFHGNHSSESAAQEELASLDGDPSEYEIQETARHTVLVLDEHGEIAGPAEILMKSSNLSVSRAWNTRIQTDGKGAARWALVWKLNGKLKKGKEFTWHVFEVNHAGPDNTPAAAPEHIFVEAAAMYSSMKAA